MGLSNDLIEQFVKATNDKEKPKKEEILYGTTVISGDKTYVRLDGSNILTPVISTADVKNADRVTVMIKEHNAVITGNLSAPSARYEDLVETNNKVTEQGDKIVDAYGLIAEKADIKELTTINAHIKKLDSEKATVEDLKATNAEIKNLKTDKLDVSVAEADYLKADTADLKFATIENLKATNIEVNSISSDFADIKKLSVDELSGKYAFIKEIDTDKLSADVAQIDEAWIKDLMVQGKLIAQDGTAFELTGVHINGDLIEANTLKADKLLLKNSIDGLYYELNTNGGTFKPEGYTEEQLQNGLLGKEIVAHSITADQLTVNDIVGTGGWINFANGTFKYWNQNTGGGISWDGKELIINANKIQFGPTQQGIDEVIKNEVDQGLADVKPFHHVRYAPVANPRKEQITEHPQPDTYFMGEVFTKSELPPDDIALYKWVRIRSEDTVTLKIDSSKGSFFKADNISTTLDVTVYSGSDVITDITALRKKYGPAAKLEWQWLKLDESDYGVILDTDPIVKRDGFQLLITPDNVDAKVTFRCSLVY